MMKQSNLDEQKRHRRFLVLILLAAVVLLSFAGVTVARYVTQQTHSGVAEAKSFYFTSDLLCEVSQPDAAAMPVYYIDPQAVKFEINLFNWADSKRVTSDEISYTVDIAGGTAVHSGIIAGGIKNNSVILVSPNSGSNEITVTVSSDKPYKKTLVGKFKLAQGNKYNVEDKPGNTAAVLTITCTDGEKDITIKLPDGVIPDATDDRVRAADGGGYIFHSPGKGVYSVVLLKSDVNQNLSESDGEFAGDIQVIKKP